MVDLIVSFFEVRFARSRSVLFMTDSDDVGPLFFVKMEVIFEEFVGRVILGEVNAGVNVPDILHMLVLIIRKF
jgi:hypothetical protein